MISILLVNNKNFGKGGGWVDVASTGHEIDFCHRRMFMRMVNHHSDTTVLVADRSSKASGITTKEEEMRVQSQSYQVNPKPASNCKPWILGIIIGLILGLLLGSLIAFLLTSNILGIGLGSTSELNTFKVIHEKIKSPHAKVTALNTTDEYLVDFKKMGDDLAKCHQMQRESKKTHEYEYKTYTKEELTKTIDPQTKKFDAQTLEVVEETLLKALNDFTDKKRRNNAEVCKFVSNELDKQLGRDWACVIGDFVSYVDRPDDGEYVYFQLDNHDGVEIFKVKRY